MNQENLNFLKDALKYLGFGEHVGLQDELEKMILTVPKAFTLSTEVYFEESCKLEGLLFFRKSDQLDMYFFNKYEASLRYPDNPERDRKQTFYINKGSGVSFKEAFNLLQGRSVNKDLLNMEGEKYNAWLQLNFEERDAYSNYKMRQFRAQYGYDLETTLERYPIRELQNTELRAALLRSLKKGNMHPVSFMKSSKSEIMFIEASPQYKTINIYPISSPMIPKTFFRKELNPVKGFPSSPPQPPEPPIWDDVKEEKEDAKEEEHKPMRRRSPVKKMDRPQEDNGLLFGTTGAASL